MSWMSQLRHSSITLWARSGVRWMHKVRHRDGKPMLYTVSPGQQFQVYPRGELTTFLSLGSLFEKIELVLVGRLLKPGMTVIDAGANIGLYSLLAAQCVGEEGKIWAFEPSASTNALLLDNLALNQVKTVSPHRLALSDAPGSLTLRAQHGFGDLYRHLDYNGQSAPRDDAESVEVQTLDDFAAAHGIGSIDFLKIDVEGGEFRLLLGSKALLARSPNAVVMFESEEEWCTRSGCKPEDAQQLLRDLGFELYVWADKPNFWEPLATTKSNTRTVWAARRPELLQAAIPAA